MIPEVANTPLPGRMANLPRTESGYPVPFFVAIVDGKPDLRILDSKKQLLCFKDRLCGICGMALGWWCAFVTGPLGLKNHTVHDPAMHEECARYSLAVCPYLVRPSAKRTSDDETGIAPTGMELARPERMALIITRKYHGIIDARTNSLLIQFDKPKRVEWFVNGKPA